MKWSRWPLLAAVVIVSYVPPRAYGQDLHPNTQLVIANVESVASAWSRLDEPREDARPLGASAGGIVNSLTPEIRERRGALLVDAVVIQKELLRADSPKTRLGDEPPPTSGRLTLEIDGNEMTLLIVDEANDPDRQLRHVTAVIGGQAQDSYARFTIDDKSGLLAGTVSSPAGLYRLISRDATTQLVYRLDIDTLRESAKLRTIASATIDAPGVGALERRHTQAELIADIQPWFFRVADDDYSVRLRGGDMGFLSVASLDDVQPVLALLARLAPATGFRGTEAIELLAIPAPRTNEDRREYAVRYRQVIGGIPINNHQEVTVDRSGKVIAVHSSLVDPATAPDAESLLSESAAAQIASDALRAAAVQASSPRLDLRGAPRLMYRVSGPNHELIPEWAFPASVNADVASQRRTVIVNALTGDATVRDSSLRAAGEDYRHRIWDANGPTEIYQEIHDAETVCVASESICEEAMFSKANWMANTIGAGGELYADDATCCFEIGNDVPGQSYNRMDVYVTGSLPDAYAYYDLENRSIYVEGDYSESVDVLAHEMGHAHAHAYNPAISDDVFVHGETGIFVEGMADAHAAMIGELYPGFSPGDTWIVGDSSPALPEADRMDLKTERTFAFGFQEMYGNFFYRVYQGLGASYKGRIFELIMQVQKNVEDPGGDGVDAEDFIDAVETSLRPGDDALAAELNEVTQAMTPGTPMYGVPPQGVQLSASPAGCFYPYSKYILAWTGSLLASYFEFYYVHSSGQWTYDTSWSGTTIPAWVPYNTSWRTRACNAYGCSAYSNTVFTPHNQC